MLGVDATVERYSGKTSINGQGRPVVAAATEITIKMVGHQASPKEIERSGLDHGFDYRVFAAKQALRVADSAGQGDVVQWEGERFELLTLEDYGTLGGVWIAVGRRIE